jgi:eukaryotic-like serine/threonine-protein kinase
MMEPVDGGDLRSLSRAAMGIFDRDRWHRLQPMLDHALDLSGDERVSWLVELRRSAPDIAEDLVTLLSGEAEADDRGFLVDAPEQPDAPLAGRVLGAWTLERSLGHGGMGTVWLARRTDGRFEGHAAVKLLNLALSSTSGQERFRREGSILARLTHPGIARLLDAGVSGEGQSYLVLEHVAGTPVDRFADWHALSREERIGLVLQVLDAVGHAHASLIVHRDIKPSNILVTAGGVVKLLDFGIAKLVSIDGADAPRTVTGVGWMTPEFAAPEQVRGEPITTATDVYAVGVLLYRLLSGRHPTGERDTPAEMIVALLDVEPSPLGLGDLDTVLSKALRKSPAERYQTAAALSDDLQRYLRHEPVSARGYALGYRTRKFVRRNRAAVAGAAVSVLALVGATLFSMAQAREAARQRDTAIREATKAEAMSQLQSVLANDVRHPDGTPFTSTERILVAERAITRQYRETPGLVAGIITDLAGRLYDIGDLQTERAMLARARAIARDADQPAEIALADCRRANSFAYEDLIDSARIDLAEAKRALARPGVSDDATLMASCLSAEGKYLVAAGERDSGIALLRQALPLVESDRTNAFRLSAINDLADVLRQGGRIRDAIPYQARVLAELDSTGFRDTDDVPNVLTFLVNSMAELGDHVASDSTVRVQVRAYEAEHGAGQVPVLVAFQYAHAKLMLEQHDSAEAWYAHVLRDTTTKIRVFTERQMAGDMVVLRLAQGRLADARAASARLSGTTRGRRSTNAMLRARVLAAGGDSSGAARLLEDELRSLSEDGKPTITVFAMPFVTAGEWRLARGDARGADSLAMRALDVMRPDPLADRRSAFSGRAELLRARARRALGDRAGARGAAARAITALTGGYGASHSWTLEARALADSIGR